MRNLRWVFILAFLCSSLYAVGLAEEKVVKKMVKEIPIETQLFKSETLKKLPGIENKLEYFTWPSAEKASKSLRPSDETLSAAKKKLERPNWITTKKVSVTEAKRMAEKWIRTVLKGSWIPIEIHSRFLALDSSDPNGYDTICVRYEVDRHYIQVVQTNAEIAITVKPLEKKDLLVDQVIDLFLIESSKIKENTLSQRLETFPGGFRGIPLPTLKKREYRNWYWGHTYWWTDGETFGFWIKKFYGGKGRPEGISKDWF